MRRLQREVDAEEARASKTLSAEVGKGKGRSSGRAAPTKDRKAHKKDNGKEAEVARSAWGQSQCHRLVLALTWRGSRAPQWQQG